MKSKGFSFRSGDTVPYIICVAEEGKESGTLAERAYHVEEIRKPGSNLKIGKFNL
jgi:DNA polymerase alpha subunit A